MPPIPPYPLPDEFASPYVIHIDPVTGQVSFDFEGRIAAEGIDITAHDSDAGATPEFFSMIRWHDPDDNAVGIIWGEFDDEDDDKFLQLCLDNGDFEPGFKLSKTSLNNPDEKIVSCWAEIQDPVILMNSLGGSRFIQHGAAGGIGTTMTPGWRMAIYDGQVNPGNLSAHSGLAEAVSVPEVNVGDIVVFLGLDDDGQYNNIIMSCRAPIVDTNGVVRLSVFNADTVAVDEPARTGYFLVIHTT